MPFGLRPGLLLPIAVLAVLGCEDRAESDAVAATEPTPYAVPMRDGAELDALLVATCESARRRENTRVLIEFSAAWCSDCRKLDAMKQSPALARELSQWSHVAINVGRFDHHRELLDALAVRSIAHWSIFESDSCSLPLPAWPRLARRTLEVSSGAERDLRPADLAAWLAELRGA